MLVSWLFLLASLWGGWFTYNAFWPIRDRRRGSVLSFFAGWPTAEFALHHLVWQVAATLVFAALGAFEYWPGQLGFGLCLVSWYGLVLCYGRHGEAGTAVEKALRESLGEDYEKQIRAEFRAKFSRGIPWKRLVFPFPVVPRDVERIRDIPYARAAGLQLKLDVYRPRWRPEGCPTLLQIHGGAWIVGSKNEQGLPLMTHLASHGWVCVAANYRLSPHATFPDHLVDLKRAIRWIREQGPAYGADPEFLVVTGGSAGGHLAALVALTANDPEYQPGFENVDTRVRAAVPFYGVYDFRNRFGHWRHDGLAELLERQVLKAAPEENPEAYRKASPIDRIHPDAPPFFVIHGDLDTLVPVDDARRFVEELRKVSRNPVVYAEIPGAQHAFDMFYSWRTSLVVEGVERFLTWVYSRYLEERATEGARANTGEARTAHAELTPTLRRETEAFLLLRC
ncbi:MAG: alpha/beta hydrolase [Candidatus Binatia bacterium]|nr:MAG: alpha/beta hydrolase [Candidatus Binatia bacterium]